MLLLRVMGWPLVTLMIIWRGRPSIHIHRVVVSIARRARECSLVVAVVGSMRSAMGIVMRSLLGWLAVHRESLQQGFAVIVICYWAKSGTKCFREMPWF